MLRLAMTFVLLLVAVSATENLAAPVPYPIHVSTENGALQNARDQEVFLNGTAPWHLVNRLTRAEAVEYLDDREQKGFNALLLSILITGAYDGGPSENRDGEPPFTSPGDFSAPNEAYFEHVDWLFEAARERGFLLFVTPAYLGYDCREEGWCEEMRAAGSEVLRGFGRFLGQRYTDQSNIVWVHGGDAGAFEHGVMELVDAVAEGILEVDEQHLHTAHCSRYNSAVDCYDRPWLDFNTVYGDCTTTPGEVRNAVEPASAPASVYIEGRYEFESDASSVCIRSQAYWALLGGAQGHFFGSGKLWDFPADWREGLDSAGSMSMAHFGRLMRSRRFDRLEPDYDHSVLVSNYQDIDGPNFAAAARTSDGQTLMIYTPDQRTLPVDLARLDGRSADAWWFNPITGEATHITGYSADRVLEFTPPSVQDWVLVIDDVAADLGPPGERDLFELTEEFGFGEFKGLYAPEFSSRRSRSESK